MKRTHGIIAVGVLTLTGAFAQEGSWTNKAGHVLSANVDRIQGTQVIFTNGTKTMTYPLSAFLPSEQQRLKEAAGRVEIPDGLKDAHALVQRTLKRLRLLHDGGEISPETYQAECTSARRLFRTMAEPWVKKGLLTDQQVSSLCL